MPMTESTGTVVSHPLTVDAGRLELDDQIRRTSEFANGDNVMLETLTRVPDAYAFEKVTRDISSIAAEDNETRERISTTSARGPNQGGPARGQPSHTG